MWKRVKKAADAAIRKSEQELIAGSDANRLAVDAARKNLSSFSDGKSVRVNSKRFQDLPEMTDSIIVCNPPYGVRMGEEEQVASLLKEFGDYLKQKCAGSTAYIYFGMPALMKKLGLKPSMKTPLSNGGLEGQLGRYELY